MCYDWLCYTCILSVATQPRVVVFSVLEFRYLESIHVRTCTLRWCQKWFGMAHDSIVLSEVSVENFEHAWKRFQLAATAKQWQEEKQLQILPTLLRGNLVDYYMDLSEEENESLEGLKQALERKAGIKKDPLVAAKYFNSCHHARRTGNALLIMRRSCARRLKRLILRRMLVWQCCCKRFCQGFVLLSLVRWC